MAEPTTTFVVPISNGIFEHCEKIGVAIWIFLWCVDKTTKEVPGDNGWAEGLVYGGRPIRAQEIARELRMAPRTVQTHLNHLVSAGYLRRIDSSAGSASGYAVRRSKKWKSKLAVVEGGKSSTPVVESAEGAPKMAHPPQISADPSPISAQPPQKMAQGAPNSAALYRNNTQTIHRLNNVEDFQLTGEPTTNRSEERIASLVETGWKYFLERTKKRPMQYAFDKRRRKMGLAGMQSLVKYAKQGRHPDPETAALELLKLAIDRLAESEFHNGKNDQNKKYLDWHQLFRGGQFAEPTKLLEYWLDDDRWPA